jgi:hypothetical protein
MPNSEWMLTPKEIENIETMWQNLKQELGI